MKKALALSAVLAILFLSGCRFQVMNYNRQELTYNSNVKSISIKGDKCELEFDPPVLGKGKVTDAKASECRSISIGDNVVIQEITINKKHSTRIFK